MQVEGFAQKIVGARVGERHPVAISAVGEHDYRDLCTSRQFPDAFNQRRGRGAAKLLVAHHKVRQRAALSIGKRGLPAQIRENLLF